MTLAKKRSMSVEGEPSAEKSKGGRPSKMGQVMRASREQAQVLSDATMAGGEMVAQAITNAVELQLQEAREVRKEEAKRRKKERREDRKENRLCLQMQSEAMLKAMQMIAHAIFMTTLCIIIRDFVKCFL